MQHARRPLALFLLALVCNACAWAETTETETWNAKFQSTYVWQNQQAFRAAYSGPNSLQPARALSYSFTATAAFGLRTWEGGEAYFNAEAAQGVPLSGLTGLGGFTNGEMARTSGPHLSIYRARAFVRHTVGFGGGSESVASDMNQLAGMQDRRRLVLTAGNLGVVDLFDDNSYSHDPRTQFLNWSLMSQGSYDFAADARGYTWGAAAEWYDGDWALRIGRFMQPREPNQQQLDRRIGRHYGDQIELERGWTLDNLPGKARVLLYRNRAVMARFSDALALAAQSPSTVPDLDGVRTTERSKRGVGFNLEQALTPQLGAFARAGWADGKTEAYAFTEIDRSLSAGLLLRGEAWGRAADTVGLAFARNALSRPHREYLAAGGLGFFLGDGQLRYRPETIVEAFYSAALSRSLWLSLDWQHIRNPAYNADRGPVNVGTVRLHAEF
jgi:hypothetical protein